MKIHSRRELKNMPISNSADIEYKDFLMIYRKCTKKAYSFLIIDTTLSANNSLRFKKNILNSL